jgi:hypothetical protein
LLLTIIPAFYLSFTGIINIPGLSPIIKNAGTLLNIGQSEAGIKNKVKGFIIKHDWEPSGGEYIQKVTIPQTFSVTPGDFPTGLYWAYVNVLSKDAGLDISNYKGSEATAHIVPLSNKFGDGPNQDVRAVVIENSGNILGGWIDGGKNYGPYVSLNRKYFGDIIEKSWGQWLIDEGISNYSKGYGADLLKLSPEDVIRKYYEAVDKKDYKTAHSMETMSSQFSYLWMNMDDSALFNNNFGDDLSNITSAKVKDIKLPFDPSEVSLSRQLGLDKLKNRKATDIRVCQVTVDMNFKQEFTSINGENVRFVTLVKETSDSPWQIDSIGTGP